jgi:sulfite reductase beta subunit-like hemoprotein
VPIAANKIEEIKTAKDSSGTVFSTANRPPSFFMLRISMPNGVLTSVQLAVVAEIANRCGRGAADLTARQVFSRLASVGLHSQQIGMDNVRSVDQRLQQALVGRCFSNIPRKFNIAVADCRADCIPAQTHDRAVTALNGVSGFNSLFEGVLGGQLPELAQPLHAFVTTGDSIAVELPEKFHHPSIRSSSPYPTTPDSRSAATAEASRPIEASTSSVC